MDNFTNMTLAGIGAIIFWEMLDFISPRLKVGLTAALMASQKSEFQSVGVIIIFKVFWNGTRNYIRTFFKNTYQVQADTDGIPGA